MTTNTSHRTAILFILTVSLVFGATFFTAGSASAKNVPLFDLTDYKAQDGDIFFGLAGEDTHITVADGATITLRNAAIVNISTSNSWAGITLLGDATIILMGSSEVKGGDENYPGILVPENSTLRIKGSGSLTVSSNGSGAGIGGRLQHSCGNIIIDGGNITAKGSYGGAGIGGSTQGSCGNITINNGIITATGGRSLPGIGGSSQGSCGNITINRGNITAKGGDSAAGIGTGLQGSRNTNMDITIKNTVDKITVIRGDSAPDYIGAGVQGEIRSVNIQDGSNIIAY